MAGGKSRITVALSRLAGVAFLTAFILLMCTCRTAHDAAELNQFWNAFLATSVINAIGSLYFLAVPCLADGSHLWRTIILVDVVVDMLVIASLGAGWQTYSQIVGGCTTCCDQFHDFCTLFLTALIISSVGFSVSFVLLVYILHVSVDPFLIDN